MITTLYNEPYIVQNYFLSQCLSKLMGGGEVTLVTPAMKMFYIEMNKDCVLSTVLNVVLLSLDMPTRNFSKNPSQNIQ